LAVFGYKNNYDKSEMLSGCCIEKKNYSGRGKPLKFIE